MREATRRHIMVRAAVVAATLAQASDPDPVFAAIAKHGALVKAFDDLPHDNAHDVQLGDLVMQAEHVLNEVVATTPTTLAGCAALLRYVDRVTTRGDQGRLFEDYYLVEASAADLLSRIAAVLDRAA